MRNKFNLLLAGFIAAGAAGCKQYSGGSATITPTPLEVRGDSVVFTADITLPANKYKKGMTYVARPELNDFKFNEGRVDLDQYPDAANSGVQTSLTFRAPYNGGEMDGESLDIEQEFIMPNGKVKDGSDLDNLASCCTKTPGLFMVNNEFMSTDLPAMETEPQKLVSQFNFPQDVWVLDQNALSESDVNMIKKYLEDPEAAGTIEIHGFASPEGPYDRNEFLSQKRAEVVKDLLTQKLRATGYTGDIDNRVEIKINQTIEDWDGFTDLVKTAHQYSNEEAILMVAASTDSPEKKEADLTQAAGGDIMALEPSLAPLRRTVMVVPCKVRCVSPEEVDSVAVAFIEGRADVEDLKEVYTREQWLKAAQATKALEGKKSLLVAYYDTYPTDYRVYNEMGVDALLGNVEIKVEDDEYKIETDDYELKVEDDQWKLETAEGLEVKVEDDEMKIDDGDATAKFEDDEYTVKDGDYKLQVEDDELSLEEGSREIKLEDDHSQLEDGDLKIKISHNEEQVKIKDTDFVLKMDGNEMKVREDGTTLLFEDVENDAVAQAYLERYEEAFSHFERAMELKENDNVVLSNIGSIYVAKNNIDEAKSYLTNSLMIKETPQAFYNLGVVLALEGNYEEAINNFNAAGDNPKYLYNRGLAKLLSGDYTGAAEDMKGFIQANPDMATPYYVMAIIDARTSNPAGVTTNLRKAAEMDESLAIRAANDSEFKNYQVDSILNYADNE